MNRIKIYGERDVEIDRNEGRTTSANLKGFAKTIFQLGATIQLSVNVLDMLGIHLNSVEAAGPLEIIQPAVFFMHVGLTAGLGPLVKHE